MKQIYLLLVLLLACTGLQAQNCKLIASAPSDTITCGQSVFLSAHGQGHGNLLLAENFNNGSYGAGWSSTTQATWTNPCSPAGIDSTIHVWMGDASPVPRILNTAVFNLTSCAAAGVTLCFDMILATQGNAAPCEGPDEPQEGIYVQYRTPGDTGWMTIHYFDPNGGSDPSLINWRNWCFNVPLAALTANTQFRWYQNNDSGADYDHWGIDNVAIYCNDVSYTIVWEHDGYNAGPAGGVNPTPVAPKFTTSYPVVMTNGTYTCVDTVFIAVRQPGMVVNAGVDTIACLGQCVQLNAATKVVTTFANTIAISSEDTLSMVFFPPSIIPAPAPLTVSGLNIGNIQPGDIHSVCITGLTASVNTFSIELICPDGDIIMLVPDSITSGGSLILNGYSNTCFVTGGNNIATGTAPYTGSWQPDEPFSNLTGCSANGLWQLKLYSSVVGPATLTGWSIAFNDPEVSYAGNFVWEPVTNMTDSNTLSPTVCPEATTAYVLTLTDTAGCAAATDTVIVVIDSCLPDMVAPFTGTGSAWYINPLITGKTDNCAPVEATDTTINGTPCSQVPGVGCLFVQNDTVYRICNNSTLFMYDYNAQPGDIWHVYDAPDTAGAFPGTAVTIHVDSVDQVIIHSQTLRRIKTKITDAPFVTSGYVFGNVIEGIGSSYYFLPQRPQAVNDSILPFVTCFNSNLTGAVKFEGLNYTPADSCDCAIVLSVPGTSEEQNAALRFNSFEKTLSYFSAGAAAPATLQIYNIAGQKLISEKTTQQAYSVSVAGFAAGIYVAVVNYGNNKMLTQKFVVTE